MATNEAEVSALVERFTGAAFRGHSAWFLGAGVCRPAGLVSWFELLAPVASELGISLTEHDDLPAIAQYYINKHAGNRGPLIQHLREALDRRVDPSAFHFDVARSNVTTIWTTNYDELMERALGNLQHRVRVRESDMVELGPSATIEVIKAHGSFNVSSPSELVISSEDYEDYAVRMPAMVARLRHDLLTKSILFVGYSYGDPNVQAIMVEARRVAARATLPHWMLQVEETKDKARRQRQQFWSEDLARIGIKCVLVESYDRIAEIVARVARRSRGPTIYVTGSHTSDDARAAQIGKLLADAKKSSILLDGQSEGVSRTLLTAFQAECVRRRLDLNERLRIYPNPYTSNPALSNDPSLLPILKQWRGSMMRQAHSMIAFDGGMGTAAEVEIAAGLGCCIVPVPASSSGSAMALLDQRSIADDLERRVPGYLAKARSLKLTAEDVVECVLEDMPQWSL